MSLHSNAVGSGTYSSAVERDDHPIMASPLFSLPPELRNVIYRILLTEHEPHQPCQAQVLATCKQIYEEASKILYAENDVYISISEDFTGRAGHAQSEEQANRLDLHVDKVHWHLDGRHRSGDMPMYGCRPA